jgi:hypothetical protein
MHMHMREYTHGARGHLTTAEFNRLASAHVIGWRLSDKLGRARRRKESQDWKRGGLVGML